MAGEKRNEMANKYRYERVLDVGRMTLLKVKGLCCSLVASWEGLYKVERKSCKVNCMMKKKGGISHDMINWCM